jgi:hypothetical protein
MSAEENKAIVCRWFTEIWGKGFKPDIIDEVAARTSDSSTRCTPLRGQPQPSERVRDGFRSAFPDQNFWGTADLIAEGDFVVGQWEGGGTQTGTDRDKSRELAARNYLGDGVMQSGRPCRAQ